MTREEQDKLWAELSEESKERVKANYQGWQEYDFGDRRNGVVNNMEHIFGKHNLQPKLTYEGVMSELMEGKDAYYTLSYGVVPKEPHCLLCLTHPDLCTSERHMLKLDAINKLLGVAKFLNKNEDGSDWVPDWKDMHERKYYPLKTGDVLGSGVTQGMICSNVYFRTDELFNKAVQILGEDIIRTALTTEY